MPKTKPRPPLRRFHFPVDGLVVRNVWRVGNVRIDPPGRLRTRAARDIAVDEYRELPGNTGLLASGRRPQRLDGCKNVDRLWLELQGRISGTHQLEHAVQVQRIKI